MKYILLKDLFIKIEILFCISHFVLSKTNDIIILF